MSRLQVKQDVGKEKSYNTKTPIAVADFCQWLNGALEAGANSFCITAEAAWGESTCEDVQIQAVRVRDETDGEMNKRILSENEKIVSAMRYQERLDLMQYEQLKKKFGNEQ